MDLPLLIDGERLGFVNVWTEGLFTVFDARCQHREGLFRLSVYGQGKEGYLGVMQPGKGGLYLRRRLSRHDMSAFPESMEYASASGIKPHLSSTEGDNEKVLEEQVAFVGNDSSFAEAEDELIWFRRPDGSLVCHDGKSSIVALPASLRREIPGAVLRYIDGGLYMLFRY